MIVDLYFIYSLKKYGVYLMDKIGNFMHSIKYGSFPWLETTLY
jgi:hypothetical protein